MKAPQEGDLLAVRMKVVGEDGFHRVFTARRGENENSSLLRSVTAPFNQVPDKNFGFVQDVFVDGRLIEKHKLAVNMSVSVKACPSFDKKKEKWGWKAFKIEEQTPE